MDRLALFVDVLFQSSQTSKLLLFKSQGLDNTLSKLSSYSCIQTIRLGSDGDYFVCKALPECRAL